MEPGFTSKFKQLFGHGAVYGIGSMLQALLGFVLIPLYTKKLTPEMYGAWALITLCGTLAGVVFYLGVSSALARSYYDYPEGPGRKAAVNTALLLTSAGALLQILLGLFFSRHLSNFVFGSESFAPHIAIALAGSAFGFVNQLFYVVLRFQRRSKAVVTLNLLSVASGGGLIIYLLIVRKMGVLAPVIGESVNQGVMCVALAWCAREWFSRRFSWLEVKVQLLYGLPTVANGLLYYLHTSSDRYLIKRFCALFDVGVYSLGSRIGMLISVLLILPFAQIWNPVRMELRNKTGTSSFIARVMTYYVISGLLIVIGLSIFAREMVAFLGRSNGYSNAHAVVPLIVFANFLFGLVSFIDTGIIYQRRIMYLVMISACALLVNWVCNFLLLPRVGFVGAGISLLVSMTALVGGIYVVSNRLLPIAIEGRRIAVSGMIAVIAIALGASISASSMLATITMKVSLLLSVILMLYCFVISREEKDFIKQRAEQIRMFFRRHSA